MSSQRVAFALALVLALSTLAHPVQADIGSQCIVNSAINSEIILSLNDARPIYDLADIFSGSAFSYTVDKGNLAEVKNILQNTKS